MLHSLDKHFLDNVLAFFVTLAGLVTFDVSPSNERLASFTCDVTDTVQPSH